MPGEPITIEHFVIDTINNGNWTEWSPIRICNRMRPSRIKDKFSRVFSKSSQNCPSRVATRAICENFENTSENLSLILRGLNAITCL